MPVVPDPGRGLGVQALELREVNDGGVEENLHEL